jgi:peptide/nickel transport system substrate-binding protein
MKLKKIFALLLVVCMTAALLAGCGGNSAGSDTANTTPASSDTGADTAPASSDASAPADTAPAASGKTQLNVVSDMFSQPNIHDLSPSWFVVRLGLAETLVRFGEDSSYQPWLATSWEVADDNLTWTFHLQEGVKFSNGADMTATKVKESIEYLYEDQDPANGGVGAAMTFMTYTSITADDAANTVTIVTTEPVPDMPGVMAYPCSPSSTRRPPVAGICSWKAPSAPAPTL